MPLRYNLPVPNLRKRFSPIQYAQMQMDSAVKDFVGIEMQVTPVYTALEDAYNLRDEVTGKRKIAVAVLEGGSRSSKTHSIIQFLIKYAQDNIGKEKRVLIARQKSTWTKATVLHDFLNVLKHYKLYNKKDYNKTTSIYRLHDCEFWFGGLDDDQKLHGFQSNIFWINEAVEATKDDFDQLEQRLLEFCILDYNPSAEEHWIYDTVCKRPDAVYIHSTMLHNPFIAERSRLKILSYEPTEENYKNGTADKNKWEIYGLGLRSKIEGVIFTNWTEVPEIPEYVKKCKHRFGLDWGYTNDPTAIVDVYWSGKEIWVDEICFQTGLFYSDIAKIIKATESLRGVKGWGDSSDPRGIDEVYRAGVNVHAAQKPPGSVIAGITILKDFKIYVTKRSLNIIKELKNYKWAQDKAGKYLNEPLDDFNHCFVGDTMIDTIKGLVPIKNIQKGDFVLTPQGYKEVLVKWDNGIRKVNKYRMLFDTFFVDLECTPNHKIHTQYGWQEISKLKQGSIITLNKNTMGSHLGFTQANVTTQEEQKECTFTFGRPKKTRKFRKAFMCTTSTKTHTTTNQKTSVLKKLRYICLSTQKKGSEKTQSLPKNFMLKELRPQKNGTQAKRGAIGTKNTLKTVISGTSIYQKKNAIIASKYLSQIHLEQNFAQTTANRPIEENLELTTSLKNVNFVKKSLQQISIIKEPLAQENAARVYDLTVKDAHEYFANGIRVHNCLDALRYVAFMEIQAQKSNNNHNSKVLRGLP